MWADPNDRTPVSDVSGQNLVPILALDEERWIQDPCKSSTGSIALFLSCRSCREPDQRLVGMWAHQLGYWLSLFERLLTGRDYLFGDEFSAADCAAFPFLKYSVLGVAPGDDELFHRVLVEVQPHDGRHPRLEAWVRRVDERPRA